MDMTYAWIQQLLIESTLISSINVIQMQNGLGLML